jgi:phosphate uptake regulator
MVMSFFRKGESGLDLIAHRTVTMLADARHSFDLASAAVLSGADAADVGADIRETDERINRAEQELRGELVTHVAVHGSVEIGSVLSYTLLIKKIERIGDQAKNILDLADEGVSLAGQPDTEAMLTIRREISKMMTEAAELLTTGDIEQTADFRDRADALRFQLESAIREFMHSEEPAVYAVPRAILYRYWKRIVANLGGVVTSATEPLLHQDYLDGGTTDIDDA